MNLGRRFTLLAQGVVQLRPLDIKNHVPAGSDVIAVFCAIPLTFVAYPVTVKTNPRLIIIFSQRLSIITILPDAI